MIQYKERPFFSLNSRANISLSETNDREPRQRPSECQFTMETSFVNDQVDCQLSQILDDYRLNHCRRTAELAGSLASQHAVDEQRAHLAGLLHDCGKGRTIEFLFNEKAQEVEQIDVLTRQTKPLHHSFASAYLARTRFGVRDQEILHAIQYHPTGSPEFGDLGRILYLGDFLEPGRRFAKRDLYVELAMTDLSTALSKVIQARIRHLKAHGKRIHPRTLAFLDRVHSEMRLNGHEPSNARRSLNDQER